MKGSVITLFLLINMVVFSAMNLPHWQIGDWWEIEETVKIDVKVEGFQPGSNLTIHDDTRYTIVDITTKTQEKTGKSYEVYVMEFDGRGKMNVEGVLKIIGLDQEVRIVNGDLIGEQWNRTEDMSVVRTYRKLTGILQGKGPDGQWRDMGAAEVNLYEEYDPPIPYGYPLEVGKNFSYTLTAYLYGNYSFEFVGVPIENSFNKTQNWVMYCNVKSLVNENGCQYEEASYYIEGNHYMDNELAVQQGWVEPRIKWYNKVHISHYQHPLGIVTDGELCLKDANVAYEPEPTPTPTPDNHIIDVELNLNKEVFHTGDEFLLTVQINNPHSPVTANLFVVLDLSNLGLQNPYYFWPGWVNYPQGLDYQRILVTTGSSETEILRFIWNSNGSSAQNILFWSCLFDESNTTLLSNISSISFDFYD